MSRLPRVFIDTSELFPYTIMDVLLTLSEDLLFTWVWTDEVLDEWQQVIVREGRRDARSAASVAAAVRNYFGRHRIEPALYANKITDDLSPDPDDRVHAAACVFGDVDVLLTRNATDLQTAPVGAVGVVVLTSDAFLCSLLSRHRGAVVASLVRTASRKRDPLQTVVELVERLDRAGTPRFAERVRPFLPR